MHLATDRLSRLHRSLELALNQEWPKLSATQKKLTGRIPKRIVVRAGPHSLPVIATVATDGGENRLSLEPIRLQVVRVADSLGEIYFEEFIAQSLKPEEIVRRLAEWKPVVKQIPPGYMLRYVKMVGSAAQGAILK